MSPFPHEASFTAALPWVFAYFQVELRMSAVTMRKQTNANFMNWNRSRCRGCSPFRGLDCPRIQGKTKFLSRWWRGAFTFNPGRAVFIYSISLQWYRYLKGIFMIKYKQNQFSALTVCKSTIGKVAYTHLVWGTPSAVRFGSWWSPVPGGPVDCGSPVLSSFWTEIGVI